MAWGRRPMLLQIMRQGSGDLPNQLLQTRCREIEAEGALCASVFVGFPNADIEFAGLSAVVVTDGDDAQARHWCDELLALAWAHRQAFVYTVEPLADSMARAKALAETKPAGSGPVVLLDHSDNCASAKRCARRCGDSTRLGSRRLEGELRLAAVRGWRFRRDDDDVLF